MGRGDWKSLGLPEKTQVSARRNAYHGSTVAGASLGGMKWMHEQGNLPIEGLHHIAQPYWYAAGGDLSSAEFGLKAARELEEKIDEIGEGRVAAFVAEPKHGAGGAIITPPTDNPENARIRRERHILQHGQAVWQGKRESGRGESGGLT